MFTFWPRVLGLIAFIIAIGYIFIGKTTDPMIMDKCLFIGLALWIFSAIPWSYAGDRLPARKR